MEFHREYLVRLPLPLAQLYSRAYNAKNGRGRHDNVFYLLEALIKLTAAPLVMAYLDDCRQGAPRSEALDRLLAQLALPSLGQWLAMLRELARFLGTRPDAARHPLGHLWEQLRQPRRDLPGLLALYRRIKNGPDGDPAGDQACSLLQVFEALVQYRNGVFGHGAGRFDAFYETEMGPLLFPAANDVLAEGTLDPLGPRGSRLVYQSEVRTLEDGTVECGLRELVGLQGERLPPIHLRPDQAVGLVPNRVAVLWPGRTLPLALDPLLVYREGELADELLFLNRDRSGRQVEYLSYTTGRTERDRSTAPALAALLSQVVRREVSEADLDALAEQSRAETLSVEALLGPAPSTGRQCGDYEFLAELGRGGMGVVYLARQRSLGRLVALKTLPADLAGDEVALARFRREIRSLARCEHPNIVKVLASGTLPDGQPYYTMEYVPGCNLESVWRELSGSRQGEASTLGSNTLAQAVLTASRKHREQAIRGRAEDTDAGRDHGTRAGLPAAAAPAGGAAALPVPPLPEVPSVPEDPGGYARRIAALVRDAALALQAVHDQGIVHRDVKPANLMLTPDGSRVVLMDFGLAKGQSLTLAASRGGGFLGTLRYAAPEQLAAARLPVGPPADVRGLGVILWELLTRRRLFEEADDERQLATLIYDRDVPRLRAVDPGLDRDLEAIVARATERAAADRIRTARELADYLQLYLDGKPLPIRPPTPAELLKRWALRHKPAAAAVASVLITAVIAFVLIASALAEASAALQRQRQAEKARALGQVDALLDATPEAVPELVKGLELNRPEVLARLRELQAGGTLPEGQSIRVALALVPADPGMMDYLREELLRASPREMLAIREVLAPHAAELRGPLWQLVEDPATSGERKLRAAVALAVFDRDDPRWARLARDITGPFLSANPMDVGVWIDGLRPVQAALRAPLADAFRHADQPDERLTAAHVLAAYAADSPDLLADLAADADPRAYAILFPVIAEHREQAIAWLNQELDRLDKPLQPDWHNPPPDPSWNPPDPALVRQIEQAQGMLAEHFALCQTMPLDQFLAVAEALRPSGYRPACFRPYPVGKAVQVAAVWLRDGRDWRLIHDTTAEEVRKQDAAWQKQGLLPEDVGGYATADTPASARYAALWIEPGRPGALLDVGLPYDTAEAVQKKRQTAGLIVHTESYFDLAGVQQFSAVWWKPDRLPDLNLAFGGQDEAMYVSTLSPSNRQEDVRLNRGAALAPPRAWYAGQLAQAQAALLLRPDDLDSRLQRGRTYFLVGQDRQALGDLDQVIAKAPQATFAYYWRALARARLGQVTGARQDLAAFQKRVNDAGANAFVDAAVSSFLGEEAAALKRLEAALARHPDDSYFRAVYAAGAYGVAARAVADKHPDQAKVYADRAVALLREAMAGGFIGDSTFNFHLLQTMWFFDGLWDNAGFQALLRDGHAGLQVSAVWNDTAEQESAESHGLDPARHVARCRELAGDHYRPAGISVISPGEGQPLFTASAWDRPVVPDADREARARRRAQVAVTLLRLDQPERVWPLLRQGPDPRVRTYLIHRLSALGADPGVLARRLAKEPDPSAQRALILSLGEFPQDRLPAEVRDPVVARLLPAYLDDPDPGLHAAAGWLLSSPAWGQREKIKGTAQGLVSGSLPAPAGKPGELRWYVNKEGQTLVVFPGPVEFRMGSPAGESDRENNERLHRERIPRSFALATREVTMAQYQRFWVQAHPNQPHSYTTRFSPDPDGPAIDVTWLEAAQYCRWLSEREGVPEDQMCFPPLDQIKEGMVLPEDYLHRTGYRLPTVAEWEYASRAGAETARSYGGSDDLLARYARYTANSEDRAWPVGRLMPNDFGLFDVYGNVWEWCQDHRSEAASLGAGGQPHTDWESQNRLVLATTRREMRGGSFLDPAGRLRSAYHNSDVVTNLTRGYGLRVARTVGPKPAAVRAIGPASSLADHRRGRGDATHSRAAHS